MMKGIKKLLLYLLFIISSRLIKAIILARSGPLAYLPGEVIMNFFY
jgi:hypothetical protein